METAVWLHCFLSPTLSCAVWDHPRPFTDVLFMQTQPASMLRRENKERERERRRPRPLGVYVGAALPKGILERSS